MVWQHPTHSLTRHHYSPTSHTQKDTEQVQYNGVAPPNSQPDMASLQPYITHTERYITGTVQRSGNTQLTARHGIITALHHTHRKIQNMYSTTVWQHPTHSQTWHHYSHTSHTQKDTEQVQYNGVATPNSQPDMASLQPYITHTERYITGTVQRSGNTQLTARHGIITALHHTHRKIQNRYSTMVWQQPTHSQTWHHYSPTSHTQKDTEQVQYNGVATPNSQPDMASLQPYITHTERYITGTEQRSGNTQLTALRGIITALHHTHRKIQNRYSTTVWQHPTHSHTWHHYSTTSHTQKNTEQVQYNGVATPNSQPDMASLQSYIAHTERYSTTVWQHPTHCQIWHHYSPTSHTQKDTEQVQYNGVATPNSQPDMASLQPYITHTKRYRTGTIQRCGKTQLTARHGIITALHHTHRKIQNRYSTMVWQHPTHSQTWHHYSPTSHTQKYTEQVQYNGLATPNSQPYEASLQPYITHTERYRTGTVQRSGNTQLTALRGIITALHHTHRKIQNRYSTTVWQHQTHCQIWHHYSPTSHTQKDTEQVQYNGLATPNSQPYEASLQPYITHTERYRTGTVQRSGNTQLTARHGIITALHHTHRKIQNRYSTTVWQHPTHSLTRHHNSPTSHTQKDSEQVQYNGVATPNSQPDMASLQPYITHT